MTLTQQPGVSAEKKWVSLEREGRVLGCDSMGAEPWEFTWSGTSSLVRIDKGKRDACGYW